jgi:4a-hydroxytetrahydrobiopterin dehydratase
MERLSEEQIGEYLAGQASDWRREGDSIVRELKLDDFAAAMALVNEVAGVAEEANHHPDILIHGWNRVRLTLSTHSAGGLTEGDFALAKRIDALT